MSTILNSKYLSMPEQVQKNKNDIEIINQYLQNVYKTSSTLNEGTTSINIENTDIDINNLNFSLLIDRQGHIYKIVDVIGEVVYLSFLTNIPGGTEYNFTGEWVADNNEYYENDLVLYNGNLYLCEANVINSSTPPNQDIAHWSLFVGYGNDVSEFVNNEYNKQKNKLNYRGVLPSTQNGMTASFDEASGGIRFTGTPTLTYARVFDTVNTFLPAGDYVFSVLEATGLNSVLRLTFEDNTTQDYYIVPQGLERKITTTKNIIKYRIFVENIVVGREYDLMLYYQLESGTKRTNWVKWYGEIVNKLDITPVLLWKNGNINTDNYGANTITVSESLSNFEFIEIYYKLVGGNRGLLNCHKILNSKKYGEDFNTTISAQDGTTTIKSYRRTVTFNDENTVTFSTGYDDTSGHGNRIVPIYIYGSNY